MALTGRKVFVITATAFAVIIGVNLTLAYQAVATFPGLEVDNSYVASQTFDAERKAQEALGWKVATGIDGDRLTIAITDRSGAAVAPARMAAKLGRATERQEDQEPAFDFDGSVYSAPVKVGPGYWNVWLDATAADGTEFRQRLSLHIRG